MNKLIRWFKLPYQIGYILFCLFKQKRFNKKYLQPIVQPYFDKSDETLNDDDYKKIFQYYGLAIPAILGNMFCLLRGEKITHREKLLITFQSALTGLVDDYFDKYNMSTDRLYQLLYKKARGEKLNEKLGVELFSKCEPLIINHPLFYTFLNKVINSQDLSRNQLQKGKLQRKELLEVTMNKGGDSFIFFAYFFFEELSEKEEAFFYQLGGIIQFGNDIFDLYKDSESQVDTLLTTANDMIEVKNIYLSQIKKLYQLSDHLHFKQQRIELFLDYYVLGVISRCLVCLDQYISLQKQVNLPFQVSMFTRTELICDMEKPINLIKAFKIDIKKEANIIS